MRVLHIVPSFYPAFSYGGPIYSVYSLCDALARGGCELKVLTTNTNGLGRVLDVEPDCEHQLNCRFSVRYCRRKFRHAVSPALLTALPQYLRWADVVHLTAVYNFPTLPTLLAARARRKPVVWSPRGALQRWPGSRRPVLKRIWEMSCRAAAARDAVLHVTSEEEASESMQRMPRRVVLIPNGVDIPQQPRHVPGGNMLRLLFLGRLDPKKGIENLLSACGRLPFHAHEWHLKIAGDGDKPYVASLQRQIAILGLETSVAMLGEVTGPAKADLFAHADVCVVPSFTENFGMVVAEALAHGVPVIASRGTPWSGVESNGCGLWINNDPDSLAAAITLLRSSDLIAMGLRGRNWMEQEFAWDRIASRMKAVYSSLCRNSAVISREDL